eukprot:c16509_g1_i2.p1 GENE.c16509_g1_i2~~c16509_g1_i2.p1  ORF type:complete len:181 (+),score=31.69 c16509_g1_i2:56-598(+)
MSDDISIATNRPPMLSERKRSSSVVSFAGLRASRMRMRRGADQQQEEFPSYDADFERAAYMETIGTLELYDTVLANTQNQAAFWEPLEMAKQNLEQILSTLQGQLSTSQQILENLRNEELQASYQPMTDPDPSVTPHRMSHDLQTSVAQQLMNQDRTASPQPNNSNVRNGQVLNLDIWLL